MIMKKSQSILIRKTPEWDEKEVSYTNEVLEFALNSLLICGEKKYEVSVLLTNDKEIRQLNKKYRNIDKATNVLSFSIENDAYLNDLKMIGDLVLSKERIIKEITDFDKKKLKIKKKRSKEIEVISGPYKSVNLLKNDYIKLKNIGFEEMDIFINE